MRSSWSDPLRLNRYLEAPREKGVYLIGTSDIDSLPVIAGDSTDLYLGANFSYNFFMLYIGQSITGKSTIKTRISAHVRGRSNKHIGRLAAIGYPLFFTTMVGRDAAELESLFLIGIDPPPIFNTRDEVSRSSLRRYRETFTGMSQSARNRLARQASVDDEFDPY